MTNIVEDIEKLKPHSIFDVSEKDFFVEYDDVDGPSNGHDYMRCNNYYEVYYAISKYYQPKSILEIGVRYGYSLYSLIKGSDQIKSVYGYDIDEEIYSNREWVSKKLNIGYDDVSPITIASSQIKKFCNDLEVNITNINTQEINELNGFFDLIHIDGDHSYEAKVHDLEITKQKGKVIIVDDYSNFGQVKMATDNFVQDNLSLIKNHYLLNSIRGTYIIEYHDLDTLQQS